MLLFGFGGSVIAASKIAFLGWGIGSAAVNFTGFSGHTALSASVWPVACWLAVSRRAHRVRVAAALFGLAVRRASSALSRLALYAHSKSEVAAGFALGVARQRHSSSGGSTGCRIPRVSWMLVLLSLRDASASFLHPGTPAPTQGVLEVIAMRLAGTERPYTRADLLARRQKPSRYRIAIPAAQEVATGALVNALRRPGAKHHPRTSSRSARRSIFHGRCHAALDNSRSADAHGKRSRRAVDAAGPSIGAVRTWSRREDVMKPATNFGPYEREYRGSCLALAPPAEAAMQVVLTAAAVAAGRRRSCSR